MPLVEAVATIWCGVPGARGGRDHAGARRRWPGPRWPASGRACRRAVVERSSSATAVPRPMPVGSPSTPAESTASGTRAVAFCSRPKAGIADLPVSVVLCPEAAAASLQLARTFQRMICGTTRRFDHRSNDPGTYDARLPPRYLGDRSTDVASASALVGSARDNDPVTQPLQSRPAATARALRAGPRGDARWRQLAGPRVQRGRRHAALHPPAARAPSSPTSTATSTST